MALKTTHTKRQRAYISVICTFCAYYYIHSTNINGALHLKNGYIILSMQNVIEPTFNRKQNHLIILVEIRRVCGSYRVPHHFRQ